MKRLVVALLAAPLCGAFLLAPAHAQKTKAQITTQIGTTFPDNTVGAITPAGIRTFQTDLVNSIMPTAPVVSGNLACFNGTTGLLQDCGVAPGILTIGGTNVTNGSSTNVLFNNAGKLGEYTVTGGGNVVMSSGASISGATVTTSTINCANNTCSVETAPFTASNASPAAVTIQQQLQRAPVMCETYTGGCTAANIQQAITDAATAQRCFQFNGTYTVTAMVSLVGITSNLCLTGRGGLRGPSSGTQTAVLEIKNTTGITVDGNISLDCNANAYITSGLKLWSSGTSAQFNTPGFSQYANCRQGIVIGDSSQSTLPLSEINIPRGFFFNVAQGIRVYSSNAVVNINGFTNNVDPSSSANWNISFTATCTGTSVAVTGINANGYLDQYDVLTGTGMPAGTYIVGQVSGTVGGNGTYTVNQACTSAANAITSQVRGINIWTSGGTVSVVGGEVINTVVNNGYLCLIDVMASPNSYGNCMFTGSVLETGGSYAASFNPTAIGSPTGGGLSFAGNRGFVGGLTTTDLIVTDSTFPGNVSVSNNRFFGTAARTGRNIVANTTLTKIYSDLGSFGDNMLQGAAGLSGGTQFMAASLANATLQTSISAPTGTTSATGLMMGMGATCKLTPAYSTRVQVWFVGDDTNTGLNTNTRSVRYGTGSAPANAAALTGTSLGNNTQVVSTATGVYSFNLGGLVTGLTPGTAYWFDMGLGTNGGTASLTNMNCTVMEF